MGLSSTQEATATPLWLFMTLLLLSQPLLSKSISATSSLVRNIATIPSLPLLSVVSSADLAYLATTWLSNIWCNEPSIVLFDVYVNSSNETKRTDIDQATRVLSDVGINIVIYRKDIPIKHFSDQELRLWAKQEKSKGTKFAELFNKMAPNGMPVSDVSKQWHIVKEVYGVK